MQDMVLKPSGPHTNKYQFRAQTVFHSYISICHLLQPENTPLTHQNLILGKWDDFMASQLVR